MAPVERLSWLSTGAVELTVLLDVGKALLKDGIEDDKNGLVEELVGTVTGGRNVTCGGNVIEESGRTAVVVVASVLLEEVDCTGAGGAGEGGGTGGAGGARGGPSSDEDVSVGTRLFGETFQKLQSSGFTAVLSNLLSILLDFLLIPQWKRLSTLSSTTVHWPPEI